MGEREINVMWKRTIDWLPSVRPLVGIRPTTRACALTKDQTGNLPCRDAAQSPEPARTEAEHAPVLGRGPRLACHSLPPVPPVPAVQLPHTPPRSFQHAPASLLPAEPSTERSCPPEQAGLSHWLRPLEFVQCISDDPLS